MTEDEFKVHMGYIDGKTDADLLIETEEEELQNGKEKLHVLKVKLVYASHSIKIFIPTIVLLSRPERIKQSPPALADRGQGVARKDE